MQDVMIDIETLGQKNNTVILSIGAVKFNPETGEQDEAGLYFRCNIEKQTAREIDAGTLMWWLKQDNEVMRETMAGETRLEDALEWLRQYIPQGANIWANGVTFDIAILEHAYKYAGGTPWHYGKVRCMRTLRRFVQMPELENSNDTKHNALADAKWQANWVIQAYKKMFPPADGVRWTDPVVVDENDTAEAA